MVLKLYDFMCVIVIPVMVLQYELMRLIRMRQITQVNRSFIDPFATYFKRQQTEISGYLSCERTEVGL